MKLSRRDFLKLVGASAAVVGLGAKFTDAPVPLPARHAPITPRGSYGVLIDTAACIGCKSCQTACKIANNLPTDGREVALSATTLTVIDFKNISPKPENPVLKPVKLQCMHCQDPACVSACPVGALYKKEDGTVAYDAEKCIGCRYCMIACPFGIPKYDWNSPNPRINKCARNCMADGKRDRPACVQACPNQALFYGKREDLIAFAKDRIAKNPSQYVNQVYGEKELGGTSVMYLSGTPFEQLGFRTDLPSEPLPELTWNAQEKIPAVLATLITLLSGIAWWTHRVESKKLVEVPVKVDVRS
ncbi:MAG: 4Fe-4S dicluster domain-containing protein [Chloroflexi bacterium]|nr:4Fe-4S dicluster domain-containing protein [Chloroflexota bacterium]